MNYLLYLDVFFYLGLMPLLGGSLARGELPRLKLSHSRVFLTGLITDMVCPLSLNGIGKGGRVDGSGFSESLNYNKLIKTRI